MNVYDGERMAELLGDAGMRAAADGEDADLVVLNTCHIREKAAEKAYSDIGRLRREDGRKPMIALAGCVAQAEGAEAKAPLADDRHGGRPAGLSPPAGNGRRAAARRTPGRHRHAGDLPSSSALPARRRAGPSAFLTVQEGCDKFCTYCVVPYTRGAGDLAAVGRHRRRGASAGRGGAREIVLLGQNVNAWARRQPRPRRPDPRARRRSMGSSASATPPAIPPT